MTVDEALEPTQEPTEPTPEQVDTPPEPGSEPESKPKDDRFQKRINKVTRRAYDAERDRDYWRDKAIAAEKPPEPSPEPDPPPTRPKLADFEGDVERLAEASIQYADDVLAHDRKQRETAQETERAEAQRRADLAHLTQRQQSQVSMLGKGRDEHDDFDDIALDPLLQISTDMMEIVTDLENGSDVLYALGKNPDEAARIAQLSKTQATIAMASLSAKLNSPPSPTGSGAPPPPNPVEGADDVPVVDEDKMSTENWMKHRNRQVNARRKKLYG